MKLKTLIASAVTIFIFILSIIPNSVFAGITDPIPTTVTFGSGKSCVSRGMCNAVAGYNSGEAINVTFYYINNNTIQLSFSLSDLQNSQPGQAQYFLSAGGYIFDAAYSLGPNSIFASWGLAQGASISPNSSSTVYVDNQGMVWDTITIDYGN